MMFDPFCPVQHAGEVATLVQVRTLSVYNHIPSDSTWSSPLIIPPHCGWDAPVQSHTVHPCTFTHTPVLPTRKCTLTPQPPLTSTLTHLHTITCPHPHLCHYSTLAIGSCSACDFHMFIVWCPYVCLLFRVHVFVIWRPHICHLTGTCSPCNPHIRTCHCPLQLAFAPSVYPLSANWDNPEAGTDALMQAVACKNVSRGTLLQVDWNINLLKWKIYPANSLPNGCLPLCETSCSYFSKQFNKCSPPYPPSEGHNVLCSPHIPFDSTQHPIVCPAHHFSLFAL